MDDTAPMSQFEQKERPEPETAPATQTNAFSAPAVAATVKSVANDTYEELKDQLAKAEATITSLKNEVASGLRQRKAAATSESSGSSGSSSSSKNTGAAAGTPQLAQAQKQSSPRGTEGVPVKIVAVLCLVSFLLAYFFF